MNKHFYPVSLTSTIGCVAWPTPEVGKYSRMIFALVAMPMSVAGFRLAKKAGEVGTRPSRRMG